MSNPPQKWQEAKSELEWARRFIALIGAPYHGGGGGIGHIHTLTVDATVYHQEYNGATNYHEMPQALQESLSKVIRSNAVALLNEAILLMEQSVGERARQAKEYLAEIDRDLQRADQ